MIPAQTQFSLFQHNIAVPEVSDNIRLAAQWVRHLTLYTLET